MKSFTSKLAKTLLLVGACLSILSTVYVQAKVVTLTMLSFNDVYEPFSDTNERGAYENLQTLLNIERAKADHHVTIVNELFLFSTHSIIDQEAYRIELLNSLGVDMGLLSNYEFDLGSEEIKNRISESKFPWLTANAFGVDGRCFTGDKQILLVEVEGIKIGFFGLVTTQAPDFVSTNKEVCFSSLAFIARQMIKELKNQGADVIIALTHLLNEEDRQLSKEVPEIDVILGDHDHDPITWYNDETFIHKSRRNATHLTRVDLMIEKEGNDKIKVFPSWKVIMNKHAAPNSLLSCSRSLFGFDGLIGR